MPGVLTFDLQPVLALDQSCGPVTSAIVASLLPSGADASSYVTLNQEIDRVSIDRGSSISSAIEEDLTITIYAWYEAHGDSQAIQAELNIIEILCSVPFSAAVEN